MATNCASSANFPRFWYSNIAKISSLFSSKYCTKHKNFYIWDNYHRYFSDHGFNNRAFLPKLIHIIIWSKYTFTYQNALFISNTHPRTLCLFARIHVPHVTKEEYTWHDMTWMNSMKQDNIETPFPIDEIHN